jgi:uncharacterized protein (TIGR02246 family)
MSAAGSEREFESPEAAEKMFYHAFRDCDLAAMSRVWADAGIVCVHPGSDVLIGRDAVMRSWARILTNAVKPDIKTNILSRTRQDGMAVHVVEEFITPGGRKKPSVSVVIATNIYRLGDYGWRIIEHHSSPPFKRKLEKHEGARTIQ